MDSVDRVAAELERGIHEPGDRVDLLDGRFVVWMNDDRWIVITDTRIDRDVGGYLPATFLTMRMAARAVIARVSASTPG